MQGLKHANGCKNAVSAFDTEVKGETHQPPSTQQKAETY